MKTKILSLIGCVVILSVGCKKDFLDINTNPNVLTSASASFVMTNALNVTSTNFLGFNEVGEYWSGHWTQSNGYILSPQQFSYNYTNGDFNFWDGIYDNLYDYQYAIDNADAANQKYFKGPAKIMKALNYQALVDMYGSIPYSNALKGSAVLAPKFDDQKAVYDSLIVLLTEAIADTKANAFASAFASADIIFKGNTTKWVKFANSLKLRILMKEARVAGKDAYIIAELNKIAAEGSGFIVGEEVGVNPGFLASTGKLNPYYERWGYDPNGAKKGLSNYPRLTEFFVNSLKAAADTFRLKRLAYATGGENGANPGVSTKAEISTNYVGVPFGVSSGYLPTNSSSIGPSQIIKGQFGKPFVLAVAAEFQFLLAEAKERYGASVNFAGTSQNYYEEGVKQSFRMLGANINNATFLLTSGIDNADFIASTNKLNAIAYQKWIALANFSGLEAWSEYRKMNFPVTPQSINYVGVERPLRFYYPNTEKAANGVNVDAQGAIDPLKTRIFWDVD
jgi:hypothetical protein